MLEFLFVQLFLLVGDILPFAGLTQAIPFDGFGQDDRWTALVLDCSFVCGIDFVRIVTAAPELLQLFV